MSTAILEQCYQVTSSDVQPWVQTATYFHLRPNPHIFNKLWTRWYAIGGTVSTLLVGLRRLEHWCTGDESTVNYVNLSKFIVFRMWKVAIAAFLMFLVFLFCFVFIFEKKVLHQLEGFKIWIAHTLGHKLALA